jgi:hypothetical protein
MNQLIKATDWLADGAKEFYADRKAFCIFYLVSVSLLVAESFKVNHLKMTNLPALDKWVGTALDNSFMGTSITWLFNTMTSGPDEVYTYGNMPGATELVLFTMVFLACMTFPLAAFGYIASDAYAIWRKRTRHTAASGQPQ